MSYLAAALTAALAAAQLAGGVAGAAGVAGVAGTAGAAGSAGVGFGGLIMMWAPAVPGNISQGPPMLVGESGRPVDASVAQGV
jgi:hypothetical protein